MFSSNACKESNKKVLEWFWWNYVWVEWKHHQPDFGWKCHLTKKPRPPFLDSFGLLFNSTYCSFLRFNVTLSTLSPNPYFTPSSQLSTFMHFQFLNVHSQFFFSTCSLQNTFKSASRTISVMKMFHKKALKKTKKKRNNPNHKPSNSQFLTSSQGNEWAEAKTCFQINWKLDLGLG